MKHVMIEQITRTIRSFVGDFPDAEVANLISICKRTLISPNDYFISAGQTPQKFGFLTKGLVRYLYIDGKGREYTKAFLTEGAVISSYTAMKNGSPSPFSIQALVQSEILSIDYEQWNVLTGKNALWDKVLIALLEKGFAIKEKRERDLLLLDAESRYTLFRKEFSAIEPFIRQHIIASYLGITPIALSRVRRKMNLINLG